MPAGFQSDQYEEARQALCLLLFHFRAIERAARVIAKAGMPNEPLIIYDEAMPRIMSGDFKEEDQEIEKAILQQARKAKL